MMKKQYTYKLLEPVTDDVITSGRNIELKPILIPSDNFDLDKQTTSAAYETFTPCHKLVPFDPSASSGQMRLNPHSVKRKCAYCEIKGAKYNSGVPIRSYYKCAECNVGLCKFLTGECFTKFHELLMKYPNHTPQSLVKALKPTKSIFSFPTS